MEVSAHNIEQIVQVLAAASGADQGSREAAHEAMTQLEELPGFLSCLLEIFANQNLPESLRFLSIITFKNTVERQWTRNIGAQMQQKDAEKAFLRQKLLQLFNIPNIRWSKQFAMILARVARFDWPKSWPDLFPGVLAAVQSNNITQVECALGCLHQSLKELATKRMQQDKKVFEQNALQLLMPVRQLWTGRISQLLQLLQGMDFNRPSDELAACARLTLLCIKSLRRLLVHGVTAPLEVPEATAFFSDLHSILQQLLTHRQRLVSQAIALNYSINAHARALRVCDSILLNVILIVVEMQKQHPIAVRGLLTPFFQLLTAFLLDHASSASQAVHSDDLDDTRTLFPVYFEAAAVAIMSLISNCLSCKAYIGTHAAPSFSGSRGVLFDYNAQNEAKQIAAALCPANAVQQWLNMLLTQLLLLSRAELEVWSEDPEKFYADELKHASLVDHQSRAAAKHLLANILSSPLTRDTACSSVVSLLARLFAMVPPSATIPAPSSPQFASLLQKDAILLAVGVDPHALEPVLKAANFDFRQFYQQILCAEIQAACSSGNQSVGRAVLLRRVVLLLGEWTDLVPADMRVDVLKQAIVPALGDSDLLVRLAAADALSLALNQTELQSIHIADMAQSICQYLLSLIAGTSEVDLNCHLLKCLKEVIERLEHHIKPAAMTIAQSLPALWDRGSQTSDSDQQVMMRQSVIRIMSHLVTALGPESVNLHGLAVPMLQYCLNADEEGASVKDLFLEESFDLWLQVLQNSPALTPELESLFDFWFDLASFNTNLLQVSMAVLRSYTLFNSSAFMERHAKRINLLVADLMADSTDQSVPFIMPAVETLLTLFPAQAPTAFGNILESLIRELLVSQSGEQQQLSDRSLSLYVVSVCRLCVSNMPAVAHVWNTHAQQAQKETVPLVLEAIFDKLDSIREVYHQKTCALALAQFITTELRVELLPTFLTRILDFANSTLTDLFSDRASTVVPVFTPADFPADAMQWVEGHRVQRMIMQDPVPSIDLKATVVGKMNELAARVGQERFNQMLATVEPFVLEQLQAAKTQS